MSDNKLKEKIYRVLKGGYFNDHNDLVDVSNGSYDYVHLVIVSRKFDSQTVKDRYELIWDELESKLTPEEWGAHFFDRRHQPRRGESNITADVGYSAK